jgi:Skp family chaperone for outer membrane proteins
MKKFVLYLSFILACFTTAAQTTEPAIDEAQPNPQRAEKIKALYVAYITQQLNLTPDDAQKFWPVHAQYEAEIKTANQGNTDELARQQNVLNIKKKYQANFNKLLGADRCNNFYRHDGEFRKKLFDRLKQMRQQRLNNGNRPGGDGIRRRPNATGTP